MEKTNTRQGKSINTGRETGFCDFFFLKFTYQRQLQHRAVNTLVLDLLLNSQIYPLNSKINLVFSEMEERRQGERVGLRYGTYPSEIIKSPLCPLTHHQSWEVCRGRRRAHRTKAVPGPTSPLLHDTPKAGRAGQRAPATALSYSLLSPHSILMSRTPSLQGSVKLSPVFY